MPSPEIGIILQARMGSSRLPGKVMRPLAGRPMIAHAIARLLRCRTIGRVILATSERPEDDPLAQFAATLNVDVFRGSELDVLDRYYRCARQYGLQQIVRATGDNPFVDPEECDRLVSAHLEAETDYMYAFASGLPVGIGVEVFTIDALERSWRDGREPHHREHVDEHMLENPDLYRQALLLAPAAKRAPKLSFTVDTPAQFAGAERAVAVLGDGDPDHRVTTERLIGLGLSLVPLGEQALATNSGA